jgi:hypothetical protein
MDNPSSQPPVPSKSRRRWLRFSLRTLVVAVTLFCLWLGVTSNRANQQRRAVDALRAAGAEILYDYQVNEDGGHDLSKPLPPPPGPDWLRNIIGLDYFATAVCVDVHPQDDITDETFDSLANLPHLRRVSIVGLGVTDARIARLGNLKELHTLFVRNSSITDGGWELLEHLPQLKRLRLDGPNVSDSTLGHVKVLVELTHLYLIDNQVSDSGLKNLEGLSQLEVLWLYGHNKNLRRDFGFRPIGSGKIANDSSAGISDAGLRCLEQLSHLKVLNVYLPASRITSAGLQDLKRSLPNLKVAVH